MITDFQYALTSIVFVPFFTAIGLVIGGIALREEPALALSGSRACLL